MLQEHVMASARARAFLSHAVTLHSALSTVIASLTHLNIICLSLPRPDQKGYSGGVLLVLLLSRGNICNYYFII
jgi:hypothetical protein